MLLWHHQILIHQTLLPFQIFWKAQEAGTCTWQVSLLEDQGDTQLLQTNHKIIKGKQHYSHHITNTRQ